MSKSEIRQEIAAAQDELGAAMRAGNVQEEQALRELISALFVELDALLDA